MAMARRRRDRTHALDIAACGKMEKPADWDAFIRTGALEQRKGLSSITPRIAYYIRRLKANNNMFVEDDGSDPYVEPFDAEQN